MSTLEPSSIGHVHVAMKKLTYSADELFGLRRDDVKPSRLVCKDIFRHRLWLPRSERHRVGVAQESRDSRHVTVPESESKQQSADQLETPPPMPVPERPLPKRNPAKVNLKPCRRNISTPAARCLSFATLNVRSLNNRAGVVKNLMNENSIDVMLLTETWHEDNDASCIRLLRSYGFQVIERARPIPAGTNTDSASFVNHGGVAIVARPGIKMQKMKPKSEPTSFEH